MRLAPNCPGKTPPWYGRFTPAESTRYTIGIVHRMAISCARRIFLIVSGHHEPAFTVGSFATTTTARPSTTARPVTTPADGACPSYWSYATSNPTSSNRVPVSHKRATRSRADSFPWLCNFLSLAAPPPCWSFCSSSRSSASSDLSLEVTLSELRAPRTSCGCIPQARSWVCPARTTGRYRELRVHPYLLGG